MATSWCIGRYAGENVSIKCSLRLFNLVEEKPEIQYYFSLINILPKENNTNLLVIFQYSRYWEDEQISNNVVMLWWLPKALPA